MAENRSLFRHLLGVVYLLVLGVLYIVLLSGGTVLRWLGRTTRNIHTAPRAVHRRLMANVRNR